MPPIAPASGDPGHIAPHHRAARLRPKESLVHVAYARIKRDILELRMQPGRRYSEQELADSLQVSRTPLRAALHILAHEGYLQHVAGHASWRVRPLELDYYEDLYDFRVDIEGLAVRRICQLAEPAKLAALHGFWSVPAANRDYDGQTVADADEAFHRALVALAGNREMLRTFDDLTDRLRVIRRLDFVSRERIGVTYDEHARLLAALDARDADLAEHLVKAHIEASRVEIRKITLHHMDVVLARAAG